MGNELKNGVTFRGKAIGENAIKAIKNLGSFVTDQACCTAYMLAEACCPELRDETILMRIAHLCLARHPDNLSASRDAMVFVLDCLRVGRLTGERPADAKYSVDHVTGAQHRNKVALVHELFKKQHLVEFIFHEAALVHHWWSLLVQITWEDENDQVTTAAFRAIGVLFQEVLAERGEQTNLSFDA